MISGSELLDNRCLSPKLHPDRESYALDTLSRPSRLRNWLVGIRESFGRWLGLESRHTSTAHSMAASQLSCPIVTVMQAAESRLPQHAANTHGTSSPCGCLLAEPEVRSVFMVVAH